MKTTLLMGLAFAGLAAAAVTDLFPPAKPDLEQAVFTSEPILAPIYSVEDVCLFISHTGQLSRGAPPTPNVPAPIFLQGLDHKVLTATLPAEEHLAWLNLKSFELECAVLIEVTAR